MKEFYFFGVFIALGAVLIVALIFVEPSSNSEGFTFTQDLSAANKLTPDTFTSHPRFSANRILSTKESLTSEEKSRIAAAFNAILARVAQDKLCRGGSYTIEPTFSYKNGVEKPVGQRVEASLSCKIKADELDAYNALIADIDKIASKSGFIAMSMPALHAQFDAEALKKNELKLREELILSALATATHYTKLTGKTCSLTNLNFSKNPVARLMSVNAAEEMAVAADSTSFKNALPVVGEEEREINAVGSFVCK